MQFTLSYDNGKNSFSYQFSGDQTPQENIIEAFRMAIDTLFPEALFVVPEGEVHFEDPSDLTEAEEVRIQLYDEVDTIIDEMYGYFDE